MLRKLAKGGRHMDENTRISRAMTGMYSDIEDVQGIRSITIIQERASMNSKMAWLVRALAAKAFSPWNAENQFLQVVFSSDFHIYTIKKN